MSPQILINGRPPEYEGEKLLKKLAREKAEDEEALLKEAERLRREAEALRLKGLAGGKSKGVSGESSGVVNTPAKRKGSKSGSGTFRLLERDDSFLVGGVDLDREHIKFGQRREYHVVEVMKDLLPSRTYEQHRVCALNDLAEARSVASRGAGFVPLPVACSAATMYAVISTVYDHKSHPLADTFRDSTFGNKGSAPLRESFSFGTLTRIDWKENATIITHDEGLPYAHESFGVCSASGDSGKLRAGTNGEYFAQAVFHTADGARRMSSVLEWLVNSGTTHIVTPLENAFFDNHWAIFHMRFRKDPTKSERMNIIRGTEKNDTYREAVGVNIFTIDEARAYCPALFEDSARGVV